MRRRMSDQSGRASWLVFEPILIMPSHPVSPPGPENQMSLSADANPVHTLDAANRILAVNSRWVEFMRTVVPFSVDAEDAVGRSLWDFISGTQVRQVWEVLFERVRGVGAPVFVPMRADTADLRRVLDVEL